MHANVWLFTVNDPPSIINCLCCAVLTYIMLKKKQYSFFYFLWYFCIHCVIFRCPVESRNIVTYLQKSGFPSESVMQYVSMVTQYYRFNIGIWCHSQHYFVNSLRSPLFRPLYVFFNFFSTFQSFDSTTFDKFKLLKCLSTTCYYCL
jgi:hypothetical protein